MSNITFTMIKPDAVANGHTGNVINDIIAGGFSIKAMKYLHLSKEKAEAVYPIMSKSQIKSLHDIFDKGGR